MKYVLLLLCALAPLMSGCQITISVAQAPGAQAVPGLPGPTAPATTTALPPIVTGQGAPAPVPGAIGTGGASAPVPPTVTMPAPEGSAQKIARLVQTYGIKNIYGTMAQGALLDSVEEMLRRYPVGALKDLSICCEPSEAKKDNVADQRVQAYWVPENDGTQQIHGKIFLFREKTELSTLLHESAHHLTLYADIPYGIALLGSLGYTFVSPYSRPIIGSEDYKKIEGTWNKTNVPDSSYNRDYAKTHHAEHMAELMMLHLGGDEAKEQIFNPSFMMPAGGAQTMTGKLGPARQTTGQAGV